MHVYRTYSVYWCVLVIRYMCTLAICVGDFPDIEDFKGVLQRMDFYTFPKTNRVVLNQLQDMLLVDIPRIIALVAGVFVWLL